STTLWLNPSSESDPGATAGDTQSATTITSYGFRQDTSVGATVLVDDLRVGLSFASVLGGTNSLSPIPLVAQRSAGKIILSWANPAFNLQAAPAVTGVYTNIPGATSPYTNTIGSSPKFFRLKGN